ncbi:dNA-directed RNA polymerase [Clostridium sp. CAG:433]|jgi:DNA-directed RNA polymerase subunit beta'|nr:dNA-directed RNA polymerase [Clostridium sp. CAG:433]
MDVSRFEGLKISIASPEKIREWSHGEVKKPETINYRTLKPERDGLFCEKIFGPTKDYECSCGKYKRLRYKDIVCDRCGVEVTKAKVRRERMGHIELATPVSHIWFFKGVPSRMGLVLDMSPRDLEEVLYFVSYVVINPGNAPLEKKQTLSDKEYRIYYEKYGNGFEVGMGAEAIKKLLQEVNIDEEIDKIEKELEGAQEQKRTRLLKRLEILDSFRESGNKPEWMILDCIPVIPPELRPMIQLDGGRFATSDLNDLYRRVINRNNRLKKLLELGAPSIIVQNEKRMLQEAVDALFDNGRRGRNVTGPSNRALKSLSSMLKGKQGRFRQNLLGKRVDYSGRSVIVVGPSLKMYECGIPKEMALELFKPHVIRGLVEKEIVHNIKSAKKMIENQDDRVWDVVEEVIKEHPVLLNRAPTLHRLGIQAFEPKLIDGKAIRLHPLVCAAFNADFDGDQMAVHVPLSEEAQAEARILMLGANNILKPSDGKPIVTPSQDMVLGNYYLTMEQESEDEGRVFKSPDAALMAYDRREIDLHTRLVVPVKSFKHKIFADSQKDKYLITTVGKIKLNEILPDAYQYINDGSKENINTITPSKYFAPMGTDLKEFIKNLPISEPLGKKSLQSIIAQVFKRYKTTETSTMLDKLKNLGFEYSTYSGITMSAFDIIADSNKEQIISDGKKKVDQIGKQYKRGLITEQERYERVIEVWNNANEQIKNDLSKLAEENPNNPIFIMMKSGARGSLEQFRQVAGMIGLVAKPNGMTVEIPITSNYTDGLTVAEYFMSSHGSRKGNVDTALKTANSGYLTRRLVDVVQDVIVKEHDCGTIQGVVVEAFINEKDGSVIESLAERITGRYTNKKVINPETKEVIVDKGVYITEQLADKITKAGVTSVEIRTTLTCKTENGVCQMCYGRNLATSNPVEIGEAVGIMAAQSIGEPGTQLTMRTFHTGGVASGDDITQGLPRVEELFEARNPKVKASVAEIAGEITNIENQNGKYKISITNDKETREQTTNYGVKLRVEVGDKVKPGDRLNEGAVNPKELLAVTDPITVQNYIVQEVQKVYRSQGVDISDKHIEIIVRKMISRMRIVDAGDTNLLVGKVVSVNKFTDENKKVILQGKKPATARPLMLGITKASLETDSFLSAASFQETTRILTDAAIKGKVDKLEGLKENVIIGKLIPAGTGVKKYRNTEFTLEKEFFDEEPLDVLEEELL